MTSWREREWAKQARSRRRNEFAMRAFGNGEQHAVRCECGARDCKSVIRLTLAEYELVRAHATRFVMACDHENPESERVIAETARYAVIEAIGADEVKHARKTDPRTL